MNFLLFGFFLFGFSFPAPPMVFQNDALFIYLFIVFIYMQIFYSTQLITMYPLRKTIINSNLFECMNNNKYKICVCSFPFKKISHLSNVFFFYYAHFNYKYNSFGQQI